MLSIDPVEEIYNVVLPAMAKNNIEDTIQNRLIALLELHDMWKDEVKTDPRALVWVVALVGEIKRLQYKIALMN